MSGDTNLMVDIFVHDLKFGGTRRVSVTSLGTEGDGDSIMPSISTCGSFVAYDSLATNLVDGDVNSTSDVFVWRGTPCMDYSLWLPLASK
jgi:hypothetical protein